ncbi:BTE_collapsed_G0044460.mRNA.1.CDS.1 [Saccharomyces cerevisiae]|nr:BTE_collapsed_G0044460.mRNA.1.CDS.1 [Saccharomyces cerevisiae]
MSLVPSTPKGPPLLWRHFFELVRISKVRSMRFLHTEIRGAFSLSNCDINGGSVSGLNTNPSF